MYMLTNQSWHHIQNNVYADRPVLAQMHALIDICARTGLSAYALCMKTTGKRQMRLKTDHFLSNYRGKVDYGLKSS